MKLEAVITNYHDLTDVEKEFVPDRLYVDVSLIPFRNWGVTSNKDVWGKIVENLEREPAQKIEWGSGVSKQVIQILQNVCSFLRSGSEPVKGTASNDIKAYINTMWQPWRKVKQIGFTEDGFLLMRMKWKAYVSVAFLQGFTQHILAINDTGERCSFIWRDQGLVLPWKF